LASIREKLILVVVSFAISILETVLMHVFIQSVLKQIPLLIRF
ncbi:MAG: hypothetical protein ACJAQ1_000159, partial [Flavobacterium sp.]